MTNILFKNSLDKKSQKIPPIWFMRQAGRYHQHYQKLKEKYSFEELCKIPDLAAEVANGPVSEFDFDVAILFSDILFILEGLGMELIFNPGPQFKQNVNKSNFHLFSDVDRGIDHMNFQKLALQATREKIHPSKSLIGFVGGPWTLLSFAVGKHNQIKKIEDFHLIFLKKNLLPLLKLNIELQLNSGAEIVMLFDSNLYDLDNKFFESEYYLFLKDIADQFPGQLGYYSRGKTFEELKLLFKLPFSGMGFDNNIKLKNVFDSNYKGFIQGNFDEKNMLLEGQEFTEELKKFSNSISEIHNRDGWVCGLGHGINKNTPQKNVHIFIEHIRKSFS